MGLNLGAGPTMNTSNELSYDFTAIELGIIWGASGLINDNIGYFVRYVGSMRGAYNRENDDTTPYAKDFRRVNLGIDMHF